MGVAYERLLSAIEAHGYKIEHHGRDRARAQCPAHAGVDKNLSLAIGDQGVLTKCHSNDCPPEDIATSVGLKLGDLFDNGREAVYEYDGGHRVRRRRSRDGKRITQENKPQVTSLYHHPDSKPFDWGGYVVLVEGEKCVDAALRLGEPCVTTWPGGAAGVDQVDLGPLGGKHVRIIADNDEPGLRAAARLMSRLSGLAEVDGVWTAPEHKQSVDDIWLDGGTLDDLVDARPLLPMDAEPVREQPARALSLRPLSGVSSKRTRFLWDKMIPQSAVTIAAGRGGTGKSSFLIWLAGQVNNGQLPGELHGERHSVLYVSHEDSLDEVVAPRADANGVDRELFFSLGISSKEVGGVVVPRLPEDLPIIREAIRQTNAKLLIIDPITSTLQGGDNDKMADVRLVMDPLNAMAAELGVCVIGIAHFRKGGGPQADLISGSHAWRDTARAAILFARDEEADRTVITLDKINSGKAGNSFRYRMDIVEQLTDEGTLTDVARVVWEGESETTVAELINHEGDRTKQGGLANDLLEYIRSFEGRAVKVDDILKLFVSTDVKAATVRQNLRRMVGRGMVESPAFGFYQAVVKTNDPARARGGVTSVTSVTNLREVSNVALAGGSSIFEDRGDVRTIVTSVTGVTGPRAGARGPVADEPEDDGLCRGCGYPLARALVEAGEARHATC